MCKKALLVSISILLCASFFSPVFAQPPVWTIDFLGKDSAKRSEKFAERKLGSERMAEKKFNLYRRVVQNNFTHYNYYYNANNKINMVLERAKEAQKDDYSKLIGYYPYTLDNTASQKQELDSVILKATAGILLHDLRNDWIDDMYLLMGKAYLLRKDFDTAASTFQFINYNMFPRKKGEDGNRVVGTNDEQEGNKVSIANKEKQNILQKLTAKPPSRNDALIWMVRTLIEQNEHGDAASLIAILQSDPNLPKRLQDDLNDVNGYWFYTQGIYDSAAVYLEKGLSNATDKHDLARSEFLLAQLYEMNGKFDKASLFYGKSSLHTTDALMDIHAQMNNAKMRKGDDSASLSEGIKNLEKLSKKDKFENYRDVLFYSAGELAMQKPDSNKAVELFNKSLKYNEANIPYKNKAWLQLAEIAYSRKKYVEAFSMYDSLQSGDTTLKETLDKIQARRNALSKIMAKAVVIEREDSLQRIARMEPAARDIFVKKLSRKLRKEKGLKEESSDNGTATDMITFDKDSDKPRDLFSGNDKSGSNEWYFYNASVKSRGYSDFKKRWGKRANADNWRRKGAAATADKNKAPDNDAGLMGSMNPDDIDAPSSPDVKDDKKGGKKAGNPAADEIEQPEDYSYEGMMARLPLDDEKMAKSNSLIAINLFELGKIFQQDVEDFSEAINTYNESLRRFPDSVYGGEIYFNLSFCYGKLGMNGEAEKYKKMVKQNFAGSNADKMLKHIDDAKTGAKNPEATRRYEEVYNLFIEGRFEEALAQKKNADSLYGKSFWTPQLLYIEAVYHVKQKNDSMAIMVLGDIVTLYTKSPLRAKAQRMIEVLQRRKEIEEYLTNLQVTRAPDDSVLVVQERLAMVRNDSNLIKSPKMYDSAVAAKVPVIKKETDVKMPATAPLVAGSYNFNPDAPQMVAMLFDKVDITYINESKNAMGRFAADNFRGAGITVVKDTLEKDKALLLFAPFENGLKALEFLIKAQKAAPEEISWLPANKYSFIIINEENLQRMKNNKDIAGYKGLLNKQYPGVIK